MGIYYLTQPHAERKAIVALLLGAYCIYLMYRDLKTLINKKPQIVLSNKGIRTVTTKFYSWAEIKNEEVITDSSGEDIIYYLTYKSPKGREKFNIMDLTLNKEAIITLLILYRGRHDNHLR